LPAASAQLRVGTIICSEFVRAAVAWIQGLALQAHSRCPQLCWTLRFAEGSTSLGMTVQKGISSARLKPCPDTRPRPHAASMTRSSRPPTWRPDARLSTPKTCSTGGSRASWEGTALAVPQSGGTTKRDPKGSDRWLRFHPPCRPSAAAENGAGFTARLKPCPPNGRWTDLGGHGFSHAVRRANVWRRPQADGSREASLRSLFIRRHPIGIETHESALRIAEKYGLEIYAVLIAAAVKGFSERW